MASGSDDGKVKLWALHASQSVCTIDARVNVSFVKQFLLKIFLGIIGLLCLFFSKISESGFSKFDFQI